MRSKKKKGCRERSGCEDRARRRSVRTELAVPRPLTRRPLPRRRHARRPRLQLRRRLDQRARALRRARPRPDPHRRRPGEIGAAVTMAKIARASRAFASCTPSRARSAGRPCAPWRPSAAISSRRRPTAISRWRCWRSGRRSRRRMAGRRETDRLEAFLAERARPPAPIVTQRVVRAAAAGRVPLRRR